MRVFDTLGHLHPMGGGSVHSGKQCEHRTLQGDDEQGRGQWR
jgi:hypothetical protein